jgi:hypothetical protein
VLESVGLKVCRSVSSSLNRIMQHNTITANGGFNVYVF